MREVVLQIPTLEAEQNIDIDVKINGKKRPTTGKKAAEFIRNQFEHF